ncbi:Methyltransferase domain-containing protein [Raineyella antarctica]|uniref:Methyltransferase domain-containing protein n=1 Tax=Raineyella antarctica TaxID=1577474 RepID=A0A1G6HCA4_9ACTN|nr:class I SAM-dependent methyltransferase [Raineyella antarctica]SDB91774.1 Methyltransferase domain-containing protein [Raineyella antarctica]
MGDTAAQRARVAGLFDQLAPGYDQGPVPWFRPIAARLVDLLDPRAGESALDIGAGRGAATFPLCAAVGSAGRVVAVDLSPAMADLLRADADRAGVTNLDVRVGEAGPPTVDDGPYDVVAASLVLFFDPDPAQTLRSWLRQVRPGSGRIGISTFGPQDDAWQRAEAVLLATAPPGMADARTSGTQGPFASTGSLATFFEDCGATDVESHDEPLEITLTDVRAWRAWTMSLGMRQFWDLVPPDALPDILDRAGRILEQDRGEDGLLHLTQQVRYTTARTR